MDDRQSASTSASTRALIVSRLRGPSVAALAAVAVAATGYSIIEGWPPLDAIYMAVITIGQVGFNEVRSLSTAGRIWTIGVIISGFGVFVYSAASLTALFVSGEVAATLREKRRARVRSHLRDHVVVAGFGRVGRSAVAAAVHSGKRCEVIDTNPDVEAEVSALGAVFLTGDARDADVLHAAAVERAVALISSLDDPSNAVVALTARSLAPSLRIVTRVTDPTWRDRLLRAGASHAVPVYESVGVSLAATALDAEVLGVLAIQGTNMRVEEMEVGEGSQALGTNLRDLMAVADGLHILGLRRDEALTRWHEADETLCAGDVLVVMGDGPALSKLTALVRRDSQ
ncbi:MAG TPA: potassium channel protein [Ilumatobacteraceae bacterium]|nr:potassium channel protein [Ilumatobacteraceae bacterium]HRB04325.1 potassium channel protein [Ilumatobacteraceae bacterium]